MRGVSRAWRMNCPLLRSRLPSNRKAAADMTKKILIADDSVTIQKVVQITFARQDAELICVDNGDDALAKAKALKPDIVLADVMMPGKDGYTLAKAIKSDPALAGVPVLLLAGSYEPFDEGKAKASGADGHIIKPFESQALLKKVEELSIGAPKGAATPAVAPPKTTRAMVPPPLKWLHAAAAASRIADGRIA